MTFRNRIVLVLVMSTSITAITGGIGLYFAMRLIAAFEAAIERPAPLLEHMDALAQFADQAIGLASQTQSRALAGEASLQGEIDSVLADLSLLKSRIARQTISADALRELDRFVAEEVAYGHRITDLVQATIAESETADDRARALAASTALRTATDDALVEFANEADSANAVGAARTADYRNALTGREAAWRLLIAESLLRSANTHEAIESARTSIPASMPRVSLEIDAALTAWRASLVGSGGLVDAVSRHVDAREHADGIEAALQRETGELVRSLESVAAVATVLTETTQSSFLLRATPFVLIVSVVVAVGISLVFGVRITRSLTRRVDALDRAAIALSDGDSLARVELHGNDELGRLARSFNQMAQDVTELNERLEERVRRRTKALIASREEIREQERQLIQADKMAALGVLVSGLAHEVSNPNQAIRMSGDLLARCWPEIARALDAAFVDSPDALVGGLEYADFRYVAAQAIERVSRSASRIDAIVTSLKEYARQSPRGTRAPVNLSVVTKSALTLLENLISESTDRCAIALRSDIPAFQGNEQQIEQIVVNIVQNACQALTDRGQAISVSVGTSDDGRHVTLRVEDEGIGIGAEDLTRVTDPFFSTKRDRGGTGLGLSVTSRIVSDHDGTLRITSIPNEGTIVIVQFPVETEGDG